MRTIMQEEIIQEKEQKESEYNQKADQLVEKWSKKRGIGEKITEMEVKKARSTAVILENQEGHLAQLTETQISTSFSTTPENVMKIVRIGYPNSVRGEIFHEWSMQTTKDSIYYLYPQYDTTKRGATADTRTIESSAYRFASETEQEACSTPGDGSTTNFTGTLSNTPVVPYTVRVIVDSGIVGTDNGSGVFPSTTGNDDTTAGIASGTIDYAAGTYSITFTTAPEAGVTVLIEYNYNSEVSTNYPDLGQIELQLRDYQFKARPYPLAVSWSKMTELVLGTQLNIDAEEALVRGVGDELKKSLDYQALRLGYNAAKSNVVTNFDTDFATAGSDSEVMHAQAITKAINRAGNTMYKAINRGGVTKIYGGPDAVTYLDFHKKFTDNGSQPKTGAHKVGMLGNIDVYKVPESICPNDELIVVYRNDDNQDDVSIALGTLIPLYTTPKLTYKNMYSEMGIAHFGDNKILNSKFCARIKLLNL